MHAAEGQFCDLCFFSWVSVVANVACALVAAQAFLGMDHVVAAKSHGDFMSFYTNSYVVEHGVQENRYLHIAGTSIVIVLLLLHPGAILAMGAALSLGFGVFPLTRSLDNGLVEGAIVVGTFVFLAWRITGKAYVPFLVMLFGYGFAWAGHFFIEGNRPATFIYPSYSLASDFFMVYQTAMGAWAGN